jgi:heme A synthase
MNDNRTRPVSIAHLVFGLIFLGAAGLWAVGAATDAETPDLAVLAPGVLIAAGVVGLVAMVINARNARVRPDTTDSTDTVVIDEEDHR